MANCFRNFFWSPVSRIVPKNVEGGPWGVFEHPLFFQNRKKVKGDPMETLKKLLKKVSQSPNTMHKKNWSSGRLEPTSFCLADLKKS